jgi:GT2 family glycosyltransferase
MNVAVVILNYNGKNFLEKFLPSVCEHSKEAGIYIVDNCSTDDSVGFLKQNYPQLALIENSSNGGFAQGYNEGLQKIEADYYVLLNSDVEVTENWIKPCIELLESDPTIAALQPKIIAHHDKTKFEHAGAAGGFLDKNFFPFCRGRIFSEVETDEGQYDDKKEVFWATGACLFVRANLYHELGGLDADFFAHMEEIDFCWRLKRNGYKIYYTGESKVYHVGGGTLNYDNPRKTFLNFRNSLFMIFKNYEGMLFPKIFWRMVLDGFGASIFLFKFQFKHFFAVFRSHMAFYGNLGALRRKRKEIKQKSSDFNDTGIYRKNITFKKFLGGINKFSDLSKDDFS